LSPTQYQEINTNVKRQTRSCGRNGNSQIRIVVVTPDPNCKSSLFFRVITLGTEAVLQQTQPALCG
jgi:hypothetical protein